VDLTAVPLSGLKVGDMLSVSGTIRETASGERYIQASSRNSVLGSPTLKPFGMNNRAVFTSGNLATGILTKIWGRVTAVGSTDFVVSTGDISVRVICGSATKPGYGKFVTVKGIISKEGENPILLLRSSADWTEIAE
jgi:hypothetical protein